MMRSTLWAVLRRWRRRPLLPALAAGVLTAGAGTSTAVLALGYATVLRPLPYPDEAALVVVRSAFPDMRLADMGLSGPEATELAALTTVFGAVGFGYASTATMALEPDTTQVRAANVSAGFLQALAPGPLAGRLFTPEDDVPGGPMRVVIAEDLWRAAFGADADVIGRAAIIDGSPYEIIGVLPSDVRFLSQPIDVWRPLRYDVKASTSNRANHAFTVVARRAPGIGLDAARADVARAVEGWIAATQQFHAPAPLRHPLEVAALPDAVNAGLRPAARLLLGAVGLVLLIAVANTATLLIASADARRVEMATRALLGGQPWQLWRLEAVEILLLAVAAAAGSTLIAVALGRTLAWVAPPALADAHLALPLWHTAGLALAISMGAALLCALAPITYLPHQGLLSSLGADGRSGLEHRDRQLARRTLVAAEVALSVTLAIGALAIVESFWRVSRVDPGFVPEGTLKAFLTLPASAYRDRDGIDAFYEAVMSEVRRLPGTTAVGVTSGLPPTRRANNTTFVAEGSAVDLHAGLPPMQFVQLVTPDAFAALGVRISAGRAFTGEDRSGTQPVAILNERAARTYFPDGGALGGRLRVMAPGLPWLTVVGLVRDMRQAGLDREPGTEIFAPLGQAAFIGWTPMARDMNLIVRTTAGDPITLAPALRAITRRVDARVAVSQIEPLTTVVGRSIGGTRFLATALGTFALVALVLAMAGIYGVVHHTVAARTREIGVRRALGAGRPSILWLVLRPITTLSGAGLVAGAAAAAAGWRALAPFTFGITSNSTWRLGAATTALALVALAACLVPLLRALHIQPAAALRDR